jgi:DNA-binding transcriptional LysR family regulator
MQWSDRIGRRLKLRDLHVFMAVAEWRNMAKAAESLSISRSVVSKTIADLESTVGVTLVDRNKKGVEVTPCGDALIKWSRAAFDDLRQSVNEIEFLSDPTVGELRIGASEATMVGLLPEIVDRLHRKHPKLIFDITAAVSGVRLIRELRERSVEIILGRVPLRMIEDDLSADAVFDEPQLIVAGVTSRWAKRRSIDLAELVDEPWVLPDADSAAVQNVEMAFHARGLKAPRAIVKVSNIQMLTALAATGRYLTICPPYGLRLAADRLHVRALPISFPTPSVPLAIVTLKGRTISPVAELFIRCAQDVLKSNSSGRRPRS